MRRAFAVATETLGQAAGTCLANPLRSGLGALAVAVAVLTLCLVVTALDGLALYARRSIARTLGADSFLLSQVAAPGRVTRKELRRMLERNPPLRRADLRFLEDVSEERVLYAATAQRSAQVTAGGRELENALLSGTGAALPEIRDLGIERGRFFTREEERRGAQVAVIGAEVADALFPGEDPLGRTLRAAGRGFQVIGVQSRLGSSGGATLDRYVFVPLPAFERAFGTPASLQITARGAGELEPARTDDAGRAEDAARSALRARRRLAPGTDDNFDMLEPGAARSFVLRLASQVSGAAPPISAMALLAAVVVVANTTLVSVTQRTREIGVRRALGATRRQVLIETLAEAALVGLTGGTLGALAAIGATAIAAAASGLPLALAPFTVVLSVLAAGGAGLLAGFYPARKAARVDVIAALRIE